VRGKTYEDMGTFPQWISKRDIYGRDETWWSKKVRPWKGRLKETTEMLEKLSKEAAETKADPAWLE